MDLVSACLVGVACRYDGKHKVSPAMLRRFKKNQVLPVCPEQLGGLPTPRKKAYLDQGSGEDVWRGRARVVTAGQHDITDNFIRGAREVLRMARAVQSTTAYLKQKSPSCGCGVIMRRGRAVCGNGVTAALLQKAGMSVIPVG